MWNTLDEIGSLFKESRTSAGVSLEEASQDTSIPLTALEQIEEGSIGSFKPMNQNNGNDKLHSSGKPNSGGGCC